MASMEGPIRTRLLALRYSRGSPGRYKEYVEKGRLDREYEELCDRIRSDPKYRVPEVETLLPEEPVIGCHEGYVGRVSEFGRFLPGKRPEDVYTGEELAILERGLTPLNDDPMWIRVMLKERAGYFQRGRFNRTLTGKIEFFLPDGTGVSLGEKRIAHSNPYNREDLNIDCSFGPIGAETREIQGIAGRDAPVVETFSGVREKLLVLARIYLNPSLGSRDATQSRRGTDPLLGFLGD